MGWGWGWRPYVSVAQRRAQASRAMARLQKKGMKVQPVRIEGRQIAHTFWGEAWCDHWEKFSDFANRLPRGRTYVRNGSVCHLAIQEGKIVAKVSGSELYDVDISVRTLPKAKWNRLTRLCTGQVGSALELLQGKVSDRVMSIVTNRDQGLFPSPREIDMDCSCPDWATMCKHVAAVLSGTGARLDNDPQLLFRLRGVDYEDLVSEASVKAIVSKAPARARHELRPEELGEVFGIDLASDDFRGKSHRERRLAEKKSSSSKADPSKPEAPTGARASSRGRGEGKGRRRGRR